MQASTRVFTTTVHDLLFADDCALNTVTEEDIQRSLHFFATGCANFGFTISTAKTVALHQPPPSRNKTLPESMTTAFNSKLWKRLLIREARCHATRESTTMLPNGFAKPVRPSAGCRPPCGIATLFRLQ
ncbi:unnamed protein product [Schistocephalus solidus]|uniref:Reverse transcriptase domain-containing protein n=1 Tax=Schistocephalus solidus TaxID=70667 RepID=A0A183SEB5_SCHSO|nr:unnamed protein product [Schistocephalus solidus]